MARGDQRERDRAKKQKELEKRAKSQPKVSCLLDRRKTNDAVLCAELEGRRLSRWRVWGSSGKLQVACWSMLSIGIAPWISNSTLVSMLLLPVLIAVVLPRCFGTCRMDINHHPTATQQEGSKESRNANDKEALAAKVAAKAAAKKEAEEAAAKAAAAGPKVVPKKKKDKKADDSLDDLLNAGLAGGKKKGKK